MRSPTKMQMSLAIPTIVGLRWKRYPNYSWGGSEALSTIVDVAAWIIVLRTGWEVFTRYGEKGTRQRLERVEREAAMAEYRDTISAEKLAENSGTEPDEEQQAVPGEHPVVTTVKRAQQHIEREKRERERQQNLERQRQLLMRYPDILIPSPAGHYFREATEKVKLSEDEHAKQVEEERKAAKRPLRQILREDWKHILTATFLTMIAILLVEAAKFVWGVVADWISHS